MGLANIEMAKERPTRPHCGVNFEEFEDAPLASRFPQISTDYPPTRAWGRVPFDAVPEAIDRLN